MPKTVDAKSLSENLLARLFYVFPATPDHVPRVAFVEATEEQGRLIDALLMAAEKKAILLQGHSWCINPGRRDPWNSFDWTFSFFLASRTDREEIKIRRLPTRELRPRSPGKGTPYLVCADSAAFDFNEIEDDEADEIRKAAADATHFGRKLFRTFDMIPIRQLLSYEELVESFKGDFWGEFGKFARTGDFHLGAKKIVHTGTRDLPEERLPARLLTL